jgi:hypothetical protein
MDKAITTALLIVISMIMSVLLFNAAYPAITRGGESITSMTNNVTDRMKSQIEIIHAAGELDATGFWQDTNNNGQFEVYVWIKNVGELRIDAIEQTDFFFGPDGNFVRIPYSADNSHGFPYWSPSLENATTYWDPNATLKITVHYGVPLTSGRYFAKISTVSDANAEYYMGM